MTWPVLGSLIGAPAHVHGRPYRFPPSAVVDVCYPPDMATLLAASTAPAIRAMRIR
jgi:hypothetical protein